MGCCGGFGVLVVLLALLSEEWPALWVDSVGFGGCVVCSFNRTIGRGWISMGCCGGSGVGAVVRELVMGGRDDESTALWPKMLLFADGVRRLRGLDGLGRGDVVDVVGFNVMGAGRLGCIEAEDWKALILGEGVAMLIFGVAMPPDIDGRVAPAMVGGGLAPPPRMEGLFCNPLVG